MISDWDIKQQMKGWGLLLHTVFATAFWTKAAPLVFLPVKTDFVKPM